MRSYGCECECECECQGSGDWDQGRVKSQRPGALLGGADGGQNTALGHGYAAPVVHQANGFSGERHGFPRGGLPSILQGTGRPGHLRWGQRPSA